MIRDRNQLLNELGNSTSSVINPETMRNLIDSIPLTAEVSSLPDVLNAQTGTAYALLPTDSGKTVTLNNAAGITLTVPAGLGAGFNCILIQLGAGQVTIATTGTTVNNRQTHTKIAAQFGVVSLRAYAANLFALSGDTAA